MAIFFPRLPYISTVHHTHINIFMIHCIFTCILTILFPGCLGKENMPFIVDYSRWVLKSRPEYGLKVSFILKKPEHFARIVFNPLMGDQNIILQYIFNQMKTQLTTWL